MPTIYDAHPLAESLWNILRDRSEADRRLVFDALQRRLAIKTTSARQEQALGALRRWMELNDSRSAPSRRKYDDFRSAQARPKDWPSATLIRNAFGGTWAAAAAVVEGRPEADVLVHRKTSRGKKIGAANFKNILRAWIETVPPDRPLREREFLGWCAEEVDRPDSRFERVPRTLIPMKAEIGGWQEALASVGALERHAHPAQQPAARRGPGERIKPSISFEGAPASKRSGYDVEIMLAWIRWAQEQLSGTEAISYETFYEIRRRAIVEAAQEGRVLRIPGNSTIVKRLGSWAIALREADIKLPRSRHSSAEYTLAELESAVRQAAAAIDGTFTEYRYERWRREELKRLRARGKEARLPSPASLRNRFGGRRRRWEEVKKRVENDAG